MYKLLSILTLVVVSCQAITGDDKIKKSVNEYLSKTMNDFKSYEPVEFSKTDTVFSSFLESTRGQAINDSIKAYNKVHEFILNRAKEYANTDPDKARGLLKESERTEAAIDSLLKVVSFEQSRFPKKITGFAVIHSYREKNENGAIVLKKDRFYFDSSFTVTKAIKE